MPEKKPLRKWQREGLDIFDQHQGKVFLLEACPAAGKTFFMGEVVRRELHKGNADAIVVVVPSASLRTQMARDFHDETKIQLDPKWNALGMPLLHGEFRGAVVTYQWLANNHTLMRSKVGKQPTLVILDEVHHGEEEKPWGNALHNAFEPASKLLLTTGTPFRSNGNPIPFINYDQDGKVIPDYSYNYGQALSDENVVRAVFFNHHKGEMEWSTEDGNVKATFEEKLNKKGESQRLRTALMPDGEHIGELLKCGIHKIQELRKDDEDAALLVIAMDQEHAKLLAKRIRQEHGINPIVCISEDGDIAAGAIAAFKNSQEPCIIAVKMISEGVSIPRIRGIVYATNVVADLFFMQAMGRAMRTEKDHDDPTAWVFIPDDVRLRLLANELVKEREHALSKNEKRDKKEASAEPVSLWFSPLSATSSDVSATVNGISIAPIELSYAETLKISKPSLAGFSRESIATILKGAGFDFGGKQSDPMEGSTSSQPKPEKPLYEKLEDIKKQSNMLAARLHYARGIEFKDMHYRLNTAANIRSVKTCADLDKLQMRYDLTLRWLKDGIAPEVRL